MKKNKNRPERLYSTPDLLAFISMLTGLVLVLKSLWVFFRKYLFNKDKNEDTKKFIKKSIVYLVIGGLFFSYPYIENNITHAKYSHIFDNAEGQLCGQICTSSFGVDVCEQVKCYSCDTKFECTTARLSLYSTADIRDSSTKQHF